MNTREVVSKEEWLKAVKRRLGTCRFEILECKEMMLGSDGGMLGEYRLVDITVYRETTQSTDTLHFFFKTEPVTMPEQKEAIDKMGLFQKEVDVFDKLFVHLRSALKDNGQNMEWTCKCFYTRPDVIVMDNLSIQGFKNVEKIEFNHCVVAMKALANLHSASLIFEESRETQPYHLDSEYADVLAESFFRRIPGHPGGEWLEAGIRAVNTLIRLIRGDAYWLRTKAKLETFLRASFDMERPSKKFRNVVNQGDLWRTNLLFRFEDDVPAEARLIDFQLLRYAPPANDLMSFLYLSTDKELRDKYSQQLLDLYYHHMSENLKRHGLEMEQVLPREEFKKSCEYYKLMGVLIVSLYCSVIYHKKENIPHVLSSSKDFQRFFLEDRTEEVLFSYNNDDAFREKSTHIIEELIEECINKECNFVENLHSFHYFNSH